MIKKISIYGLGSFGYALANYLSDLNNDNLIIHGYSRSINKLSSTKFIIDKSPKELLLNCKVLILAVPSQATLDVIDKIKNYIPKNLIIVNTAKSLDEKLGNRLSCIFSEKLRGIKYNYALLSGGTIADDLYKQQPLGVDIACTNKKILPELINLFQSKNLKVYPTTDLTGVEYAAAFKNVISILAGIIKGMGFSYGAETHIISRAAGEVEKLVVGNLGGKKRTFTMKSQCWGNDLWMSCTGNTRNREFGVLLGKGLSVDKAIKLMDKQDKLVEGINTIKVLDKIASISDYPLLNFLYKFIALKTVRLNTLQLIISHEKY